MRGQSERIVVTGGAGFIGSHLVERLLETGAGNVVVVDDFSRGRFTNLGRWLEHDNLTIVQSDVRDLAGVREALAGAGLVYHLAARRAETDDPTEVDDVFTTNVVGTFNVLRAASDHLARRVVFASSVEAYGAPLALPVDEDHPLHTVELNGASKVSGETYCRAFRRVFGLQTVVLRLGEVFGPRDASGPISVWIDEAERGADLSVHDRDRVSDFVWVEDVVLAMQRAADSASVLPPINVASGTGTRMVDVARRIARLAAGQPRVRMLPGTSQDSRRFVANVERMRRLLEIEPPLDPMDRLAQLVEGERVAVVS